MKISCNWLKQYLDTGLTPGKIDELLTDCVLEVESIAAFETVKGGLKGLVVGEVKTCVRHPNADKLSLTTVDTGAGQHHQIVCGAPNVAVGQKVIVALPGTLLHPVSGEPFEIKKSKIRGESSEGMICAEDEIGLGISHSGIIVLPADTKIGIPAKEVFNIEEDSILEIGLTPNRADAASHIGVVRDLLAVLLNNPQSNVPFQGAVVLPPVNSFKTDNSSGTIQVEVTDPGSCPRYSGISISGIRVAESPAWLQNRLKSIGIGPINNVVDITNFVLHECGQPLHAFDADEINGKKVVVRKANAGEKFITLDKTERTLTGDDLMICSATEPMCIAGVFGGINSGISEKTKNIFLESACFSPSTIRKTSKHHGLKTDASFRFERGTDPSITIYALKRAALLIKEIASGTVSSEIIDVYPSPILPVTVQLKYQNINRLAGQEIERETIKKIVQSLGMTITKDQQDSLEVAVPTHKVDVTREVDVVEEILRIYGFNKIGVTSKLNSSLPGITKNDPEYIRNVVSDFLSSNGFNEILTNSISSSAYSENDEGLIRILNPLSQELNVMRQSLLFTGLEAMQYNSNRKQPDLKLYEFGKTYRRSENEIIETNNLALFLAGKKSDPHWNGKVNDVDFFEIKKYVHAIFEKLGIIFRQPLSEHKTTASWLTAGIDIRMNDKPIVQYGSLKKNYLRKFDLDNVFYASFDWDQVLKLVPSKDMKIGEVPKFPQVKRDLSMVIDRSVTFAAIEQIAHKVEKNLLREIHLFDVYEGDKIQAGKKSYAVSFILQDERQTLTENQIDKIMKHLMEAFEKQAGAEIRKQ